MIRAYVDVLHGQMHARLTSRGAPGLVFLPQTPSTSEMFDAVAPLLADVGAIASVDLPGFGGSDPLPGPASVDAWAGAVLEALDALGATTFSLVGHHAGASVAAALAVRAPERVRRLVLSAPPLVDRATLEARVPEVTAGLARDGGHLLAAWRRAAAKEPGVDLPLQHREALAGLASVTRHAAAYRAVLDHDLAGVLRRVRTPTLVTTGPEDPLASVAEGAAALVHAARFEPLHTGGAYVFDRHPDVVARVLRRFLTQGEPSCPIFAP